METNAEGNDPLNFDTDFIKERMRSKMKIVGKSHLSLERSLPLILTHLSELITSREKVDKRRKVWLDLENSSIEDIVSEYEVLKDIILEIMSPLSSYEKSKVTETILYYMGLSVWELSRQTRAHQREVEKNLHLEILNEKREKLWFESILDFIPAGIVIVERTSAKVLFVNAWAKKLAGGFYPTELQADDQDEYYFTDINGERIPRNDLPRFRVARGEKLCGIELTGHFPGGQVSVVVNSDVIPPSDGLPERIVVVFQEIEERKKWELKKTSEVNYLREERQMREAFVSSLTHDLRTPLSVARMQTEMVARRADRTIQDRCLKIIKHIDVVDRMIEDLLDANKLKAGQKIPIHPCEMCLNDIVNEAVNDYTDLHGDRFFIKSEGIICGFWCGKAMRRIVDNLLSNAVKYGDQGGPIEICLDQNKDRTRIRVHNFGPAIPESEKEKLFQPYKRSKFAEKKTGWGIGLFLVKGLVEAHHGTVIIVSEQNRGTIFELKFPNRVDYPYH